MEDFVLISDQKQNDFLSNHYHMLETAHSYSYWSLHAQCRKRQGFSRQTIASFLSAEWIEECFHHYPLFPNEKISKYHFLDHTEIVWHWRKSTRLHSARDHLYAVEGACKKDLENIFNLSQYNEFKQQQRNIQYIWRHEIQFRYIVCLVLVQNDHWHLYLVTLFIIIINYLFSMIIYIIIS